MLLIRKRAYARAGLVGNPSDGYHGKTISIIVRNFCAEAVLYEWDTVEIVLAQDHRAPRATSACVATAAGSDVSRPPSSGSWSTARRATSRCTAATSRSVTKRTF